MKIIMHLAGKILVIYNEAYIPEKHLFYQVVPEDLAEVLGLEIDYQILSLDGTILGVTAPDEQYVSVYDNEQECCYYLDGKSDSAMKWLMATAASFFKTALAVY